MLEISVIIPVYNVERYLCRCLDSVLLQTYDNFEIILVNDGSSDNSGKMCEEYAIQDSRIKLICQENKGLSAARNAGIDIAKGEYLTFIDSDDYVYPSYLEKLLNALIENDAEISICGNIHFTDDLRKEYAKNFEGERICTGRDACKLIYDGKNGRAEYVVAWGKMYKRELFSTLRYPVGKLHEDQFLTYQLFYMSSKVVEIGECLYGYYQNMQGIMNSPFKIKRYDDLEGIEEAESFFINNQEFEITEKVCIRKSMLAAQYSIQARKAGIYHLVPEKYKMSFLKAIKTLRVVGGIDRYEYFMFQYYPRMIRFEARLRKLIRIITGKDKQ